ncbi:hypothetical protein [Methylobacterium nodulans]|uniref:hypothetical protein n=1 Tax=Methylobacterium nodulans TaxID=114616 RepID=UPI0012EE3BB2|nr:hypothetical protein [Methylobacterium nodulans]
MSDLFTTHYLGCNESVHPDYLLIKVHNHEDGTKTGRITAGEIQNNNIFDEECEGDLDRIIERAKHWLASNYNTPVTIYIDDEDRRV